MSKLQNKISDLKNSPKWPKRLKRIPKTNNGKSPEKKLQNESSIYMSKLNSTLTKLNLLQLKLNFNFTPTKSQLQLQINLNLNST